MYHKIRGRKFGRHCGHRRSLLVNLVKSLIKHEQITTTLPKAKDLRPIVEKIITACKKNTLHARRQAIAFFGNNSQEVVTKLFDNLSKRYLERPGGYSRIIKSGFRQGDCAPMAVIEFIDRDIEAK